MGMAMIGITEGAIPFAASKPHFPCDPLHHAGLNNGEHDGHLGQVGDHAPHGGPIVIFVVDNKLMYVVAIAVGTIVTALAINLVKRSALPGRAGQRGRLMRGVVNEDRRCHRLPHGHCAHLHGR